MSDLKPLPLNPGRALTCFASECLEIQSGTAIRLFPLTTELERLTNRWMMAKKPKVNVSEVLQWECPNCCNYIDGEGWLRKGDEVACDQCGQRAIVDEHYCDCRPSKWEGKKAVP